MTRFGAYQGFRRSDGGLVRNITYSGLYNQNFFVNTSGFPLSQLEWERMKLSHNSTLWMIIENYRNKDSSSLVLGKIGIENLYPGLFSGNFSSLEVNKQIITEARIIDSVISGTLAIPLGGGGMYDNLAFSTTSSFGLVDPSYEAWRKRPEGNYRPENNNVAENHNHSF